MSYSQSNRPGPSRRRGATAKAIGAFVPAVARAAFERQGFPSAAVLADWPTIVGRELANFTAPERLHWPRRSRGHDEESGTQPRPLRTARTGATLVLRVDGPRALEVQHSAPQLIERINSYFGYGAVTSLRIVQAPVRRTRAPQRQAPPELPPTDESGLERIENTGLRAALSRLRARVA